MSRQTAIAAYCKECSGDRIVDQVLCCIQDCPLWTYRLSGPADKRRERIDHWWATLTPQEVKDFAERSQDREVFRKNKQILNHRSKRGGGRPCPTWLHKKEN